MGMDTFIDKLAQKKNAQEMIRANSAAEAAKMEQMQKQLKNYDEQMQKQLKSCDEQMQKQLKGYDELMQEMRRVNIKTSENVENMRSLLAQCMEKLDGIKGQEENGEEAAKQLAEVKTLLEERLAQTEDLVHKENVKVYRNVQAAFTEELEKQSQQERQTKSNGANKAVIGLSVAILIGVLADIVINLLPLIM